MHLFLDITLADGVDAAAVAELIFDKLVSDDLDLPGVASVDGYDFVKDH